VIEHQVHRLTWPGCGQDNQGELPSEGASSGFGPKVISLVGLLMGRYRLSKRQVTHLLAECFGITLAASTVVNQQQVISQALAAPAAEWEPVVQNEPVCYIVSKSRDEYGPRIHCAATRASQRTKKRNPIIRSIVYLWQGSRLYSGMSSIQAGLVSCICPNPHVDS
jgi:hypothetical protein